MIYCSTHNYIETVPAISLSNLPNLVTLDLSHNKLSHLNNLFPQMPKLQQL